MSTMQNERNGFQMLFSKCLALLILTDDCYFATVCIFNDILTFNPRKKISANRKPIANGCLIVKEVSQIFCSEIDSDLQCYLILAQCGDASLSLLKVYSIIGHMHNEMISMRVKTKKKVIRSLDNHIGFHMTRQRPVDLSFIHSFKFQTNKMKLVSHC